MSRELLVAAPAADVSAAACLPAAADVRFPRRAGSDDDCALCSKLGEHIFCSRCPHAYHESCLDVHWTGAREVAQSIAPESLTCASLQLSCDSRPPRRIPLLSAAAPVVASPLAAVFATAVATAAARDAAAASTSAAAPSSPPSCVAMTDADAAPAAAAAPSAASAAGVSVSPLIPHGPSRALSPVVVAAAAAAGASAAAAAADIPADPFALVSARLQAARDIRCPLDDLPPGECAIFHFACRLAWNFTRHMSDRPYREGQQRRVVGILFRLALFSPIPGIHLSHLFKGRMSLTQLANRGFSAVDLALLRSEWWQDPQPPCPRGVDWVASRELAAVHALRPLAHDVCFDELPRTWLLEPYAIEQQVRQVMPRIAYLPEDFGFARLWWPSLRQRPALMAAAQPRLDAAVARLGRGAMPAPVIAAPPSPVAAASPSPPAAAPSDSGAGRGGRRKPRAAPASSRASGNPRAEDDDGEEEPAQEEEEEEQGGGDAASSEDDGEPGPPSSGDEGGNVCCVDACDADVDATNKCPCCRDYWCPAHNTLAFHFHVYPYCSILQRNSAAVTRLRLSTSVDPIAGQWRHAQPDVVLQIPPRH